MVALFPQPSNIIEFPQKQKSNEWYTPSRYIEAARSVMGGIDLDPASCAEANQVVKAKHYYTISDDGLKQLWHGSIWLNPPYKSEDRASLQSLWVGKALDEYRQGRIEQITLVVTGVVERKWFHPLWDYPVCFPNHQIHFKRLDSKLYHHPYGTVFVYIGPYEQRFIDTFQQFGRIARAIDNPKPKQHQLTLWEEL